MIINKLKGHHRKLSFHLRKAGGRVVGAQVGRQMEKEGRRAEGRGQQSRKNLYAPKSVTRKDMEFVYCM